MRDDPDALSRLVLVNPIGLEDWRAKGVPNATVDQLYATERKTTRDSIKAYQQSTYYAGGWSPRYDRWVDMLASMYLGKGGDIVRVFADNSDAWYHRGSSEAGIGNARINVVTINTNN